MNDSPETIKAYKDINRYLDENNASLDYNIPEIHTKPLAQFDEYPLTYTKAGAERANAKLKLEKKRGRPAIEYHT
jgi:hypothetical protein